MMKEAHQKTGRKNTHILVIDDDIDIAKMIVLNLSMEGFQVSAIHNGNDGMKFILKTQPDLLILDLMLPDCDGLVICDHLRQQNARLPIIILSAKSSESERIRGLEIGADDYLTKPFSIAELIARVHAIMRRIQTVHEIATNHASVLSHGLLEINLISRTVYLDKRLITLTTKEFDLLSFFSRHAGQTFTRSELLDQIWGQAHDGYEHTVNSHINRLRNKIETKPSRPEYILTVWGTGYQFPADHASTATSIT